jgi:hypothetical protein
VSYTAPSAFGGTDTFTYDVADSFGAIDTGTVSITVVPNNAPVAADDNANTAFATPVNVPVLANDTDADGDAISVTSFDATSAHGGSVTKNNDGTLTYSPAATFAGTDTFGYVITDSEGATDPATVAITVAADPSPNAFDDAAKVKQGKSVTIDVLRNDSDPAGQPIHIVRADAVGTRGGKVVVNSNGTITYTAPKNAIRPDSFTYTISDPFGGTDTATVQVTIIVPPKRNSRNPPD